MNLTFGRSRLRMKPVLIGVLATTLSLATVTAIAVEDKASATAVAAECAAFKGAAEAAMRNQLTIVNSFMSGASSQMQAAVSKNNSCIGNLSMLDFDLSKLIPDFGLLGTLLQTAISRIVDGVINRACNALSDVIGKPGDLWNGIIGNININNQFQGWANGIDYSLPRSPSSGGSGGGAVVGGGTAPVTAPVGSTPVNCIQTMAGQVCTDGSTSGSGPSVGNSPSGVQIGVTLAQLMEACNNSLNNDAMDVNNGGRTSAGSQAACQAYQNYIYQYAAYIDPKTITTFATYPIIIPGGTGSAIGGSVNLVPPGTISGVGTGTGTGNGTGTGTGIGVGGNGLVGGDFSGGGGTTTPTTPGSPGGLVFSGGPLSQKVPTNSFSLPVRE